MGIVCHGLCLKTKGGNPKKLTRAATLDELHSDLQSGLDALSRFGGCLLGFPLTAALYPDTAMTPRTNMLPMLKPLLIQNYPAVHQGRPLKDEEVLAHHLGGQSPLVIQDIEDPYHMMPIIGLTIDLWLVAPSLLEPFSNQF